MLTLMLALGLAFATPVSPLPDRLGDLELPVALVPAIAKSALLFFTLAFLAMALFYFWRERAHRTVFSAVGLVPNLSRRSSEFAAGLVDREQEPECGRRSRRRRVRCAAARQPALIGGGRSTRVIRERCRLSIHHLFCTAPMLSRWMAHQRELGREPGHGREP